MSLCIARVLTRLNLGGPARQVLASDPRLVARGFTLRVYVGAPEPGEGDLSAALAARGVEVVRIEGLGRAIRPWSDHMAARALRRELATFRPDIVHTHASKAGFVGRHAVFGGFGLGPRLPARTVHTFHGHVLERYFPPTTSRILTAIERQLAARTDALLAVSEATADDLARLGVAPRARFELSPPGVELASLLGLAPPDGSGHTSAAGDTFRAELGVPRDVPLVLVLGRLAPIKRPALALRVFQRTAAEAPFAHLVFVGDGAIQSLVERDAGRLPADVRGRIRFAGARADVTPALAAADVLLATSESEGLPVAMIEAGAAALPVVSTAVGGVPEVVVNGVTGLLAADEVGLAVALASLLADPEERARMGLAARGRVAERFGAEALAARLAALYERSVAAGPSGTLHA